MIKELPNKSLSLSLYHSQMLHQPTKTTLIIIVEGQFYGIVIAKYK